MQGSQDKIIGAGSQDKGPKYQCLWHEFDVTFDDAGGAKISVQDGDIAHCMFLEIITAWDGDGTINLGDGADPNGFWPDAFLVKLLPNGYWE